MARDSHRSYSFEPKKVVILGWASSPFGALGIPLCPAACAAQLEPFTVSSADNKSCCSLPPTSRDFQQQSFSKTMDLPSVPISFIILARCAIASLVWCQLHGCHFCVCLVSLLLSPSSTNEERSYDRRRSTSLKVACASCLTSYITLALLSFMSIYKFHLFIFFLFR